eukprot:7144492-Lingulodinium_polyedra.AAC.1
MPAAHVPAGAAQPEKQKAHPANEWQGSPWHRCAAGRERVRLAAKSFRPCGMSNRGPSMATQ